MSIENILTADKSGSFQAVQSAVMEYYSANPEKTFQDIELELRSKKCSAFLIARSKLAEGDKWISHMDGNVKTNFPHKMKFLDLRDKSEKKHFLWLTTKQGAALLREIHQESSGYEDNFAKLSDCGVQVLDTEQEGMAMSVPSERCVRCGQAERTSCGDCGVVSYCSSACRRADWKFHGRHCKSMMSLPDRQSRRLRDWTVRNLAIEEKYKNYMACCQSGRRDFMNGADMVCVTRGGRKGTVCECCLARVGVENRERKNVIHTRVVGNAL